MVWSLISQLTAYQCPQSHSHKGAFSLLTKSYMNSCSVHPFSTLVMFVLTASSWEEEGEKSGAQICSTTPFTFY